MFPHVGDVGVVYSFTILDDTTPVDLSAATVLFTIKRPLGDIFTAAGTLPNGGQDGVVHWTTQLNDLSERGQYSLQAEITIGSNVFNTNIYRFTCYENLV